MVWRGGKRGSREGRAPELLGVLPKHFRMVISTIAFKNADVGDCITVQLYLVPLLVAGLYIPTLLELKVAHAANFGESNVCASFSKPKSFKSQ